MLRRGEHEDFMQTGGEMSQQTIMGARVTLGYRTTCPAHKNYLLVEKLISDTDICTLS